MKTVEVEFTDVEHHVLQLAAQREQLCVEEWLQLAAIGMAANTGYRVAKSSPRRDPRARTPSTITSEMMRCPHCGIETRRVATCDNCDGDLR